MSDDIMTAAEAMEAHALPRARVVHCDENTPATAEQLPLPKAVAKKPVGQKSPAEWAADPLSEKL
jgi:hypothetical protein